MCAGSNPAEGATSTSIHEPSTNVSSEHFPSGFFGRSDEIDDTVFYEPVRLVQHIDDAAIAAVGALYD